MGLFGKKKEEPEKKELLEETEEELEDTEDAEPGEEEEVTLPDDSESSGPDAEEKIALSPEDSFSQKAAFLSQRIRMMFPQQMDTGYYYAELQEDGYIDDLCCYTTAGELLERDDIPERCGMSDPEMIAREEQLEKAFFQFRRAAAEYTEKPCNGVTVILMNNGQAKVDIISEPLEEGEEDARYEKFREKVAKGNPRFQPPRLSQEQLDTIRSNTQEIYREMGQSYYNYIPGNEFRVAYFYAEFSERGVFYFTRCFLNDDTLLENDDIFAHFDIDPRMGAERRSEVISHIMDFRNAFGEANARPFSAITLIITGNGKFNTALSYGPTDEAGEQSRLEEWKQHSNGEGFPPIEHSPSETIEQKLAQAEVSPELQEHINGIYMELGTEFFSSLPDREFNRTYFLTEFSDDGVFTYERMILGDGTVIEDKEFAETLGIDPEQAEKDRTKLIGLIDDIRDIFIEEGQPPFTSMTLTITDKGEFRTYMSFDPTDEKTREDRLEKWRAKYNGGEV